MKKSFAKRLIAFVLLLSILSLTSCFNVTSCLFDLADYKVTYDVNNKAALADRAANATEDPTCETICDYFVSWGVPYFKMGKFKSFENIVNNNFYLPLADNLTRAKAILTLFLENDYDALDLSDRNAVTDALLTELVASLDDRYAFYRVAEEYEEYNTDMSGEFCGIGVTVEHNALEETLRVTEVFPDSPAEKAGILVGDYIHAVDGALLTDIGYNTLVQRIRGKEGTEVVVTVKRGEETIDLTAVREKIVEKSVTYNLDAESGIAYLRISSFKGNTAGQFIAAIDDLESQGMKAIVFDLRDNLGGYLTAITEILSYLVPDGTTVVSYAGEKFATETYTAKDTGEVDHVLSVPSIVLCNDYTASAGELFTAAMRDYNAMDLLQCFTVGVTTYKKGIMQNSISYYDGSAITLTIAFYNPPSGVNYHGVGIVPDFVIEDPDDQLTFAYMHLGELLKDAQ